MTSGEENGIDRTYKVVFTTDHLRLDSLVCLRARTLIGYSFLFLLARVQYRHHLS